MTSLLRTMTGAQNPVVDYRSLKALSNSSRVDAVKTINDLSRRLSSRSFSSSLTSGPSNKSRHRYMTTSPLDVIGAAPPSTSPILHSGLAHSMAAIIHFTTRKNLHLPYPRHEVTDANNTITNASALSPVVATV
ncbi:hypothetical protein CCHL11_01102 [Colletotrichum chlorophyti]|uniref:Uncharacterized protein n=1 Tax=Colletotrichum chlorophyti TaxID=708187 RepID=A0A1Q8S7V2_9PEZI|nr:hypothetical protein CCHL11_01102 [Colletotrichum chlorophyti]